MVAVVAVVAVRMCIIDSSNGPPSPRQHSTACYRFLAAYNKEITTTRTTAKSTAGSGDSKASFYTHCLITCGADGTAKIWALPDPTGGASEGKGEVGEGGGEDPATTRLEPRVLMSLHHGQV